MRLEIFEVSFLVAEEQGDTVVPAGRPAERSRAVSPASRCCTGRNRRTRPRISTRRRRDNNSLRRADMPGWPMSCSPLDELDVDLVDRPGNGSTQFAVEDFAAIEFRCTGVGKRVQGSGGESYGVPKLDLRSPPPPVIMRLGRGLSRAKTIRPGTRIPRGPLDMRQGSRMLTLRKAPPVAFGNSDGKSVADQGPIPRSQHTVPGSSDSTVIGGAIALALPLCVVFSLSAMGCFHAGDRPVVVVTASYPGRCPGGRRYGGGAIEQQIDQIKRGRRLSPSRAMMAATLPACGSDPAPMRCWDKC